MALNRYMHPRNPYKTPPDFAELAKKHPEFAKITKTDVIGKVTVNFKDPLSLRVLTKCLLKSDFNLDVDIPETRLVPTLPLRLNYILWIEDILKPLNRTENVLGIDIGTGACAIYPLLAVVTNKWCMVGTETDVESQEIAKNNVKRNNLESYIQIKANTTETVIEHVVEDCDKMYDFCMCNPPFYSNVQELYESRSPARPEPKNAFTGSPQELITEGGELEFVRKLIAESKLYKDKIRIYTTMVGHKYNLKELLQDLNEDNIKSCYTEFCQGRVTRWGLAWTFQDIDLSPSVNPRDKSRKKIVPSVQIIPQIEGLPHNSEHVTKKIRSILESLKIQCKLIDKCGSKFTLSVLARENTWSNQRRRKREMKRSEEQNKKQKLNEGDHQKPAETQTVTVEDSAHTSNTIYENSEKTDCEVVTSAPESSETNNGAEGGHQKPAETQAVNVEDSSHTSNTIYENSEKTDCKVVTSAPESTDTNNGAPPVVESYFKIFKRNGGIMLESEFIGGSGGKEGLHQILQYIKNNWK